MPRGIIPRWLKVRFDQAFRLTLLFWLAKSFYIKRIKAALRRGDFGVLAGRSNQEAHDQAFADFYLAVGHNFAAFESTTAVPRLVSSAHGVVLELGPGMGNQLEYLDAERVERVCAVEPNVDLVAALVKRAGDTVLGSEGRYTVLPCGLEDVERAGAGLGVREGSFDCVLSMQVMCSMPNLEDQVRHMHRLLKPGGELIFWEHCRSRNSLTRAMQWLWDFDWPGLIGGCTLSRVTREAIVGAADWEVVDLEEDFQAHDLMPRLWGRLVKAREAR